MEPYIKVNSADYTTRLEVKEALAARVELAARAEELAKKWDYLIPPRLKKDRGVLAKAKKAVNRAPARPRGTGKNPNWLAERRAGAKAKAAADAAALAAQAKASTTTTTGFDESKVKRDEKGRFADKPAVAKKVVVTTTTTTTAPPPPPPVPATPLELAEKMLGVTQESLGFTNFWCAEFASYILDNTGKHIDYYNHSPGQLKLAATPTNDPQPGDLVFITFFPQNKMPGGEAQTDHVAFFTGYTSDGISVIEGNGSDATKDQVGRGSWATANITGYARP